MIAAISSSLHARRAGRKVLHEQQMILQLSSHTYSLLIVEGIDLGQITEYSKYIRLQIGGHRRY